LCVNFRGLGSSNEAKFEGKKRFLHIAFQGRFKQDVKASDFWSGHEWFSVSDLVPTRCELLCFCYFYVILLSCDGESGSKLVRRPGWDAAYVLPL
jgi:hypothetical protein